MYDFAKEFVIFSGFGMILAIDVFGIGYWFYSLVRWVKKIKRREKRKKK